MGDFDGAPANKYGARGVRVDGLWFSSKREAKRWGELKLLEGAGEITSLRRQVPFPLHAFVDTPGKPGTVGDYVADFTYYTASGAADRLGSYVVEDAKGLRTALYRWKARHFELEYGIVISEV